MDTITIEGIEVFAHHGVLAEEKENGQLFLIDLEMAIDLRPAGVSDRIADTVDYGTVGKEVHDLVASGSWDLIEKVAEEVASHLLTYPIEAVTVTVHKPGAPLAVPFSDVTVCIHRDRR